MGKIKLMAGVLILLNFSLAHAETEDRYPFVFPQQEKQFQGLLKELRCLVCQNQDLADSNADLAKDLRRQVYNQVLAGKSDAAIKGYLQARYGNFILFKPPFDAETFILWLSPFILLAIGGWVLWRVTHPARLRL